MVLYYNNKILVKRVIAQPGEWVNIDPDGTVYVNNVELDEPYISGKAMGECDLILPYQVPESRIFVMGDHRDVSVDSRSRSVGCVADEQIVGKIVGQIWPLSCFIGTVSKSFYPCLVCGLTIVLKFIPENAETGLTKMY